MDFIFRKLYDNYELNRRKENRKDFKFEVETNGKITHEHLQQALIRTINKYIERGYTQEQLREMEFFRYRDNLQLRKKK